jgi:hypothetical protein
MAFTIEYVPDFIDDVAPKMIEAGLRIVEPAVAAGVDSAVGRTGRKGTGELKRSVRSGEVFKSNSGRFRAVVYFEGTRTRGRGGVTRNNEIAAYLNYGRPHTPNRPQAATGFLKEANNKTKKRVNDEMQRVFDEAVNNI